MIARLSLLLVALAASALLLFGLASTGGAVAPEPGPNAQSVYAVTNPNAAPLDVQHTITNSIGFNYSFWATVPASSTALYHVRDMAAVPSPFVGSLELAATMPFTAEVVDYDYPPTPTPTSTSMPTSTPTPSPTATATATPTPVWHRVYLPIIK